MLIMIGCCDGDTFAYFKYHIQLLFLHSLSVARSVEKKKYRQLLFLWASLMVVFISFYDNQPQLEYAAFSQHSETHNANLAKCKFLCTFFLPRTLLFIRWKKSNFYYKIFYGYYIDEIFMITNGRL